MARWATVTFACFIYKKKKCLLWHVSVVSVSKLIWSRVRPLAWHNLLKGRVQRRVPFQNLGKLTTKTEQKVPKWRADTGGQWYVGALGTQDPTERERARERKNIFTQHLWWEKKSHCAREGHWMWIIEQCPAALSPGIRFTWRLWKAEQGHNAPAHHASNHHDQHHDVFALVCGPQSVQWCSLGLWFFLVFHAEEIPTLHEENLHQPVTDWQPDTFTFRCAPFPHGSSTNKAD